MRAARVKINLGWSLGPLLAASASAIFFCISAFTASRLKLAPFCMPRRRYANRRRRSRVRRARAVRFGAGHRGRISKFEGVSVMESPQIDHHFINLLLEPDPGRRTGVAPVSDLKCSPWGGVFPPRGSSPKSEGISWLETGATPVLRKRMPAWRCWRLPGSG